jgi:hypothetical protein
MAVAIEQPREKVKDKEIRAELSSYLHSRQYKEETLIVNEFVLGFEPARVDVALVSDDLVGFEIKSEADSLTRLETQVPSYNKVFDYMILVASERHVQRYVQGHVPDWWGIVVAEQRHGKIQLREHRKATRNKELDPFILASLLWKDEALAVLTTLGKDWGVHTKNRKQICERLAEVTEIDQLRQIVRDTLRARTDWRTGRKRRRSRSFR